MPPKFTKRDPRSLDVFHPRLLKMLTFLSRRQEWLSPPEIAKKFRLDGKPVSAMTVYRWFSLMEEQVGLAYFPHPRMNRLGLAGFHVRIRGPRSPAVLSTIPYGHSFLAEVGLRGQPVLAQDYWVPAPHVQAFRDYWKAAVDLEVVQEADVLPVRNTHFLFSPFDAILHKDGTAELPDGVDNGYFRDLIARHMKEDIEVRIAESIAAAPLTLPAILEHQWRHSSSKHVWHAIQTKGETELGKYGKKLPYQKPGAILKLIQRQWKELLSRFDETFLQPVVFWPPGLVRNALPVSFTLRTGSRDRSLELAMRVSSLSVVTALMPETDPSDRVRIWCNPPSDALPVLLRLVHEYHRGPEDPYVGVIDIATTRKLAQPAFSAFDWRLFDPEALEWRFNGEAYGETVKALARPRAKAETAGLGIGLR